MMSANSRLELEAVKAAAKLEADLRSSLGVIALRNFRKFVQRALVNAVPAKAGAGEALTTELDVEDAEVMPEAAMWAACIVHAFTDLHAGIIAASSPTERARIKNEATNFFRCEADERLDAIADRCGLDAQLIREAEQDGQAFVDRETRYYVADCAAKGMTVSPTNGEIYADLLRRYGGAM